VCARARVVVNRKLVGYSNGRVAYRAADIGEGGLVGRQWGEPRDLRQQRVDSFRECADHGLGRVPDRLSRCCAHLVNQHTRQHAWRAETYRH
jgi:hypothetical protein